MGLSFVNADAATHMRVVAMALAAAILVVWIALAARGLDGATPAPNGGPFLTGPFTVAALDRGIL